MSGIELKGLKGLNLLLNDENKTNTFETFSHVALNRLVPSAIQPRKRFNENDLNELADSIRSNGIIQPIIVRATADKKYEIIAGERRWRAAQIAGIENVPIVCRSLDDSAVLACALIENIQRKELNIIDEAQAIKTMINKYSYTQDQVAKMLGKGRSTIANLLRMLLLHPSIIEMLYTELIEAGHARALITLDVEQQLNIANEVINKELSVRDTEKLVSRLKIKTNKSSNEIFVDERISGWRQYLSNKFDSNVNIKLNANGKSKIIINLDSLTEVEFLIKKLERI